MQIIRTILSISLYVVGVVSVYQISTLLGHILTGISVGLFILDMVEYFLMKAAVAKEIEEIKKRIYEAEYLMQPLPIFKKPSNN